MFDGRGRRDGSKAEDKNSPRVDVVGGKLAGDGSAVEFVRGEGGHCLRPVWG